jgi:hypothetical protein
VRADDAVDSTDNGPLEGWQRFARRQDVRGGSTVILALQEDANRVSLPAFVPPRVWGAWVRHLRLATAAQLQQFFDTDSANPSIVGRWALLVNSTIGHENIVRVVGNFLPPFPSSPASSICDTAAAANDAASRT